MERPGGRRVPRTGSTSEALSRSSAVISPKRQQLFSTPFMAVSILLAVAGA
jgi:hypothetical protein